MTRKKSKGRTPKMLPLAGDRPAIMDLIEPTSTIAARLVMRAHQRIADDPPECEELIRQLSEAGSTGARRAGVVYVELLKMAYAQRQLAVKARAAESRLADFAVRLRNTIINQRR
jgi:hypothetical protein